MEAVLENLSSALELLAVSETGVVRRWDAETVGRAVRWAKYCEHVHSRFHANPSVRPVLEDCVRLTNERLSEALPGARALSLADLAQCRHRLFTALLRNPAAPCSAIKALFEQLRLFEEEGDTKPDTGTDCDLAGLIMCKSACNLLAPFPLNPHEPSGVDLGTHVHGLMLLQRIKALQRCPGNDSYLKTFMDTVLQDAGDVGPFSEVIAASLLAEDVSGEDAAAQGVLLDWLQEHRSMLRNMCGSLPPELCTRLSKKHIKFRLLYLALLKMWASSMTYDAVGGEWAQQSDSPVSFKTLVDRLKAFWRSGSPLKDEAERELVALKQADGDFEVHGLSVWTDLLLQLR